MNLGTYHLRALMGDADAPTNSAEIAFNVETICASKIQGSSRIPARLELQREG